MHLANFKMLLIISGKLWFVWNFYHGLQALGPQAHDPRALNLQAHALEELADMEVAELALREFYRTIQNLPACTAV